MAVVTTAAQNVIRIIWKPITGFPRYRVSDRGEVLDTHKNRKLKQSIFVADYKGVSLVKNGKRYEKLVHRLVAEAFIPNPNNLATVIHIDSNKTNNCASNLQWLSRADSVNKAHAKRGYNVNRWFLGYYDGERIGRWQYQNEAARELKLNQGLISACLRGRIPYTCGFTFRYDD